MSPESSTKFDQPLYIELIPARRLGRCSLLLHLLAAIAWLISPVDTPGKLLALLLVGGHAMVFHRCQVMASTALSVEALSWDARRGWRIRNPASGWQSVTLSLPVYVSARLAAVSFRRSRLRRSYAVVTAERLDSDTFRRLRVRLIQSARGH